MRIRLGTLRKLIREVKLSPSLPKNNKTYDSILTDREINDLVDRLSSTFEQALAMDLILREFDQHYDSNTREFDDAAYENIKERVKTSRHKATALVKRDLEVVWKAAHQNAHQEAEPASGVRNTRPSAQVSRAA